jgi:hypothetical protein
MRSATARRHNLNSALMAASTMALSSPSFASKVVQVALSTLELGVSMRKTATKQASSVDFVGSDP